MGFWQALWDKQLRVLTKNAGVLLGGSAANAVLALLAVALTARALVPAHFGALVVIQSLVNTVNVSVNFQSWQALIKHGAEHLAAGDRRGLEELVKYTVVLDGVTALLGTLVAIVVVQLVGHWAGWQAEVIGLATLYCVVVLFDLSGTPIGVLRLFDEFRLYALFEVVTGLVRFFGVLVAWAWGADLAGFVLVWMSTQVAGSLALIWMGQRTLSKRGYGDWWRAKVRHRREVVRFMVYTNLKGSAGVPTKYLDVFLVSAVVSLEAAGVYKVLTQVAQIFTRLGNPIYQAAYPQFAQLIAAGKDRKAVATAMRSGLVILGLMILVGVVVVPSSSWWLPMIMGDGYPIAAGAVYLFLSTMALSTVFISLTPLITAMGRVREAFIITLMANAIFVPALWGLGLTFGLWGVVFAWGIQIGVAVLLKLAVVGVHLRGGSSDRDVSVT
jgi:O-antigen/teichoic acid export membrane protein